LVALCWTPIRRTWGWAGERIGNFPEVLSRGRSLIEIRVGAFEETDCFKAGVKRLIDGDNVEILPGIHAYTGARHTWASQYIRVGGDPSFVLASDNRYLCRNLAEHKASATFSEADQPGNLKNQERMIELAGSADRVVPGHDPRQFEKFPERDRIAKIR
jgi:hypothetical protein